MALRRSTAVKASDVYVAPEAQTDPALTDKASVIWTTVVPNHRYLVDEDSVKLYRDGNYDPYAFREINFASTFFQTQSDRVSLVLNRDQTRAKLRDGRTGAQSLVFPSRATDILFDTHDVQNAYRLTVNVSPTTPGSASATGSDYFCDIDYTYDRANGFDLSAMRSYVVPMNESFFVNHAYTFRYFNVTDDVDVIDSFDATAPRETTPFLDTSSNGYTDRLAGDATANRLRFPCQITKTSASHDTVTLQVAAPDYTDDASYWGGVLVDPASFGATVSELYRITLGTGIHTVTHTDTAFPMSFAFDRLLPNTGYPFTVRAFENLLDLATQSPLRYVLNTYAGGVGAGGPTERLEFTETDGVSLARAVAVSTELTDDLGGFIVSFDGFELVSISTTLEYEVLVTYNDTAQDVFPGTFRSGSGGSKITRPNPAGIGYSDDLTAIRFSFRYADINWTSNGYVLPSGGLADRSVLESATGPSVEIDAGAHPGTALPVLSLSGDTLTFTPGADVVTMTLSTPFSSPHANITDLFVLTGNVVQSSVGLDDEKSFEVSTGTTDFVFDGLRPNTRCDFAFYSFAHPASAGSSSLLRFDAFARFDEVVITASDNVSLAHDPVELFLVNDLGDARFYFGANAVFSTDASATQYDVEITIEPIDENGFVGPALPVRRLAADATLGTRLLGEAGLGFGQYNLSLGFFYRGTDDPVVRSFFDTRAVVQTALIALDPIAAPVLVVTADVAEYTVRLDFDHTTRVGGNVSNAYDFRTESGSLSGDGLALNGSSSVSAVVPAIPNTRYSERISVFEHASPGSGIRFAVLPAALEFVTLPDDVNFAFTPQIVGLLGPDPNDGLLELELRDIDFSTNAPSTDVTYALECTVIDGTTGDLVVTAQFDNIHLYRPPSKTLALSHGGFSPAISLSFFRDYSFELRYKNLTHDVYATDGPPPAGTVLVDTFSRTGEAPLPTPVFEVEAPVGFRELSVVFDAYAVSSVLSGVIRDAYSVRAQLNTEPDQAIVTAGPAAGFHGLRHTFTEVYPSRRYGVHMTAFEHLDDTGNRSSVPTENPAISLFTSTPLDSVSFLPGTLRLVLLNDAGDASVVFDGFTFTSAATTLDYDVSFEVSKAGVQQKQGVLPLASSATSSVLTYTGPFRYFETHTVSQRYLYRGTSVTALDSLDGAAVVDTFTVPGGSALVSPVFALSRGGATSVDVRFSTFAPNVPVFSDLYDLRLELYNETRGQSVTTVDIGPLSAAELGAYTHAFTNEHVNSGTAYLVRIVRFRHLTAVDTVSGIEVSTDALHSDRITTLSGGLQFLYSTIKFERVRQDGRLDVVFEGVDFQKGALAAFDFGFRIEFEKSDHTRTSVRVPETRITAQNALTLDFPPGVVAHETYTVRVKYFEADETDETVFVKDNNGNDVETVSAVQLTSPARFSAPQTITLKGTATHDTLTVTLDDFPFVQYTTVPAGAVYAFELRVDDFTNPPYTLPFLKSWADVGPAGAGVAIGGLVASRDYEVTLASFTWDQSSNLLFEIQPNTAMLERTASDGATVAYVPPVQRTLLNDSGESDFVLFSSLTFSTNADTKEYDLHTLFTNTTTAASFLHVFPDLHTHADNTDLKLYYVEAADYFQTYELELVFRNRSDGVDSAEVYPKITSAGAAPFASPSGLRLDNVTAESVHVVLTGFVDSFANHANIDSSYRAKIDVYDNALGATDQVLDTGAFAWVDEQPFAVSGLRPGTSYTFTLTEFRHVNSEGSDSLLRFSAPTTATATRSTDPDGVSASFTEPATRELLDADATLKSVVLPGFTFSTQASSKSYELRVSFVGEAVVTVPDVQTHPDGDDLVLDLSGAFMDFYTAYDFDLEVRNKTDGNTQAFVATGKVSPAALPFASPGALVVTGASPQSVTMHLSQFTDPFVAHTGIASLYRARIEVRRVTDNAVEKFHDTGSFEWANNRTFEISGLRPGTQYRFTLTEFAHLKSELVDSQIRFVQPVGVSASQATAPDNASVSYSSSPPVRTLLNENAVIGTFTLEAFRFTTDASGKSYTLRFEILSAQHSTLLFFEDRPDIQDQYQTGTQDLVFALNSLNYFTDYQFRVIVTNVTDGVEVVRRTGSSPGVIPFASPTALVVTSFAPDYGNLYLDGFVDPFVSHTGIASTYRATIEVFNNDTASLDQSFDTGIFVWSDGLEFEISSLRPSTSYTFRLTAFVHVRSGSGSGGAVSALQFTSPTASVSQPTSSDNVRVTLTEPPVRAVLNDQGHLHTVELADVLLQTDARDVEYELRASIADVGFAQTLPLTAGSIADLTLDIDANSSAGSSADFFTAYTLDLAFVNKTDGVTVLTRAVASPAAPRYPGPDTLLVDTARVTADSAVVYLTDFADPFASHANVDSTYRANIEVVDTAQSLFVQLVETPVFTYSGTRHDIAVTGLAPDTQYRFTLRDFVHHARNGVDSALNPFTITGPFAVDRTDEITSLRIPQFTITGVTETQLTMDFAEYTSGIPNTDGVRYELDLELTSSTGGPPASRTVPGLLGSDIGSVQVTFEQLFPGNTYKAALVAFRNDGGYDADATQLPREVDGIQTPEYRTPTLNVGELSATLYNAFADARVSLTGFDFPDHRNEFDVHFVFEENGNVSSVAFDRATNMETVDTLELYPEAFLDRPVNVHLGDYTLRVRFVDPDTQRAIVDRHGAPIEYVHATPLDPGPDFYDAPQALTLSARSAESLTLQLGSFDTSSFEHVTSQAPELFGSTVEIYDVASQSTARTVPGLNALAPILVDQLVPNRYYDAFLTRFEHTGLRFGAYGPARVDAVATASDQVSVSYTGVSRTLRNDQGELDTIVFSGFRFNTLATSKEYELRLTAETSGGSSTGASYTAHIPVNASTSSPLVVSHSHFTGPVPYFDALNVNVRFYNDTDKVFAVEDPVTETEVEQLVPVAAEAPLAVPGSVVIDNRTPVSFRSALQGFAAHPALTDSYRVTYSSPEAKEVSVGAADFYTPWSDLVPNRAYEVVVERFEHLVTDGSVNPDVLFESTASLRASTTTLSDKVRVIVAGGIVGVLLDDQARVGELTFGGFTFSTDAPSKHYRAEFTVLAGPAADVDKLFVAPDVHLHPAGTSFVLPVADLNYFEDYTLRVRFVNTKDDVVVTDSVGGPETSEVFSVAGAAALPVPPAIVIDTEGLDYVEIKIPFTDAEIAALTDTAAFLVQSDTVYYATLEVTDVAGASPVSRFDVSGAYGTHFVNSGSTSASAFTLSPLQGGTEYRVAMTAFGLGPAASLRFDASSFGAGVPFTTGTDASRSVGFTDTLRTMQTVDSTDLDLTQMTFATDARYSRFAVTVDFYANVDGVASAASDYTVTVPDWYVSDRTPPFSTPLSLTNTTLNYHLAYDLRLRVDTVPPLDVRFTDKAPGEPKFVLTFSSLSENTRGVTSLSLALGALPSADRTLLSGKGTNSVTDTFALDFEYYEYGNISGTESTHRVSFDGDSLTRSPIPGNVFVLRNLIPNGQYDVSLGAVVYENQPLRFQLDPQNRPSVPSHLITTRSDEVFAGNLTAPTRALAPGDTAHTASFTFPGVRFNAHPDVLGSKTYDLFLTYARVVSGATTGETTVRVSDFHTFQSGGDLVVVPTSFVDFFAPYRFELRYLNTTDFVFTKQTAGGAETVTQAPDAPAVAAIPLPVSFLSSDVVYTHNTVSVQRLGFSLAEPFASAITDRYSFSLDLHRTSSGALVESKPFTDRTRAQISAQGTVTFDSGVDNDTSYTLRLANFAHAAPGSNIAFDTSAPSAVTVTTDATVNVRASFSDATRTLLNPSAHTGNLTLRQFNFDDDQSSDTFDIELHFDRGGTMTLSNAHTLGSTVSLDLNRAIDYFSNTTVVIKYKNTATGGYVLTPDESGHLQHSYVVSGEDALAIPQHIANTGRTATSVSLVANTFGLDPALTNFFLLEYLVQQTGNGGSSSFPFYSAWNTTNKIPGLIPNTYYDFELTDFRHAYTNPDVVNHNILFDNSVSVRLDAVATGSDTVSVSFDTSGVSTSLQGDQGYVDTIVLPSFVFSTALTEDDTDIRYQLRVLITGTISGVTNRSTVAYVDDIQTHPNGTALVIPRSAYSSSDHLDFFSNYTLSVSFFNTTHNVDVKSTPTSGKIETNYPNAVPASPAFTIPTGIVSVASTPRGLSLRLDGFTHNTALSADRYRAAMTVTAANAPAGAVLNHDPSPVFVTAWNAVHAFTGLIPNTYYDFVLDDFRHANADQSINTAIVFNNTPVVRLNTVASGSDTVSMTFDDQNVAGTLGNDQGHIDTITLPSFAFNKHPGASGISYQLRVLITGTISGVTNRSTVAYVDDIQTHPNGTALVIPRSAYSSSDHLDFFSNYTLTVSFFNSTHNVDVKSTPTSAKIETTHTNAVPAAGPLRVPVTFAFSDIESTHTTITITRLAFELEPRLQTISLSSTYAFEIEAVGTTSGAGTFRKPYSNLTRSDIESMQVVFDVQSESQYQVRMSAFSYDNANRLQFDSSTFSSHPVATASTRAQYSSTSREMQNDDAAVKSVTFQDFELVSDGGGYDLQIAFDQASSGSVVYQNVPAGPTDLAVTIFPAIAGLTYFEDTNVVFQYKDRSTGQYLLDPEGSGNRLTHTLFSAGEPPLPIPTTVTLVTTPAPTEIVVRLSGYSQISGLSDNYRLTFGAVNIDTGSRTPFVEYGVWNRTVNLQGLVPNTYYNLLLDDFQHAKAGDVLNPNILFNNSTVVRLDFVATASDGVSASFGSSGVSSSLQGDQGHVDTIVLPAFHFNKDPGASGIRYQLRVLITGTISDVTNASTEAAIDDIQNHTNGQPLVIPRSSYDAAHTLDYFKSYTLTVSFYNSTHNVDVKTTPTSAKIETAYPNAVPASPAFAIPTGIVSVASTPRGLSLRLDGFTHNTALSADRYRAAMSVSAANAPPGAVVNHDPSPVFVTSWNADHSFTGLIPNTYYDFELTDFRHANADQSINTAIVFDNTPTVQLNTVATGSDGVSASFGSSGVTTSLEGDQGHVDTITLPTFAFNKNPGASGISYQLRVLITGTVSGVTNASTEAVVDDIQNHTNGQPLVIPRSSYDAAHTLDYFKPYTLTVSFFNTTHNVDVRPSPDTSDKIETEYPNAVPASPAFAIPTGIVSVASTPQGLSLRLNGFTHNTALSADRYRAAMSVTAANAPPGAVLNHDPSPVFVTSWNAAHSFTGLVPNTYYDFELTDFRHANADQSINTAIVFDNTPTVQLNTVATGSDGVSVSFDDQNVAGTLGNDQAHVDDIVLPSLAFSSASGAAGIRYQLRVLITGTISDVTNASTEAAVDDIQNHTNGQPLVIPRSSYDAAHTLDYFKPYSLTVSFFNTTHNVDVISSPENTAPLTQGPYTLPAAAALNRPVVFGAVSATFDTLTLQSLSFSQDPRLDGVSGVPDSYTFTLRARPASGSAGTAPTRDFTNQTASQIASIQNVVFAGLTEDTRYVVEISAFAHNNTNLVYRTDAPSATYFTDPLHAPPNRVLVHPNDVTHESFVYYFAGLDSRLPTSYNFRSVVRVTDRQASASTFQSVFSRPYSQTRVPFAAIDSGVAGFTIGPDRTYDLSLIEYTDTTAPDQYAFAPYSGGFPGISVVTESLAVTSSASSVSRVLRGPDGKSSAFKLSGFVLNTAQPGVSLDVLVDGAVLLGSGVPVSGTVTVDVPSSVDYDFFSGTHTVRVQYRYGSSPVIYMSDYDNGSSLERKFDDYTSAPHAAFREPDVNQNPSTPPTPSEISLSFANDDSTLAGYVLDGTLANTGFQTQIALSSPEHSDVKSFPSFDYTTTVINKTNNFLLPTLLPNTRYTVTLQTLTYDNASTIRFQNRAPSTVIDTADDEITVSFNQITRTLANDDGHTGTVSVGGFSFSAAAPAASYRYDLEVYFDSVLIHTRTDAQSTPANFSFTPSATVGYFDNRDLLSFLVRNNSFAGRPYVKDDPTTVTAPYTASQLVNTAGLGQISASVADVRVQNGQLVLQLGPGSGFAFLPNRDGFTPNPLYRLRVSLS